MPRNRPTYARAGIESDTPIIPVVVAQQVVEEVELFLKERFPTQRRYVLMDDLAKRAEATYAANESFRKIIKSRGDRGRDSLYAFMRHWLASDLHKNSPRIYARLPGEFSLGHPIR